MDRHTFKEHEFRPGEKLWLQLVSREPDLDPRLLKLRVWEQLPHGFSSQEIDPRFYSARRLTPIGLWHADEMHPLLEAVKTTIVTIRGLIIRQPLNEGISVDYLAKSASLSAPVVSKALALMADMGQFFSGSYTEGNDRVIRSIEIRDEAVVDRYLYYTSLDDVLEEMYVTRDPRRLSPSLGYSLGRMPGIGSDGAWAGGVTGNQRVIDKNRAFVLMAMDPSKPELEDVYDTIKEVCKKFRIAAQRADEIEHQDAITDRVLQEIATCEYLIADLTYERPNVYYEIGYAHALELNPILYRRAGTRLHFDLSVHNVPEYKNVTELRRQLTKRLENMTGRLLPKEDSNES